MDARIWKAEEAIAKRVLDTMDARIWKAEETVIKQTRSDTFFTKYLLQKYIIGDQQKQAKQSSIYSEAFYDYNRFGAIASAFEVFGKLLTTLEIEVNSIVDFGCGTGGWLYAAKAYGIYDVVGIDGDYVDRNMMLIDASEFVAHDLETPIDLQRNYDLGISLEVAEHLSESVANQFVEILCKHSNTVLFSAAHPGQGGDNHINEQPFEYWESKFNENGYVHVEIRDHFKGNPKVEEWYQQNIGLFVKKQLQEEL